MVRIAKGIRALLTLILGCGIQVLSVPASGAASRDVAIAVHYGDLDLADPRSIATLHHRIEVAAARLCGPRDTGGPAIESKRYMNCVNDAVSRAIAAVDRPALRAYHMRLVTR